jgi:hypothetical protein
VIRERGKKRRGGGRVSDEENEERERLSYLAVRGDVVGHLIMHQRHAGNDGAVVVRSGLSALGEALRDGNVRAGDRDGELVVVVEADGEMTGVDTAGEVLRVGEGDAGEVGGDVADETVAGREEETGAGDGALVLAAAVDAELWMNGKSQIDD